MINKHFEDSKSIAYKVTHVANIILSDDKYLGNVS